MALLAAGIVGCSARGGAFGPRDSTAPSSSVASSAEPSAALTAALTVVVPSATVAVSPEDAPSVLEVTCDGTDTVIPTPIVRTQPDGIHIRFTNTSGHELTFDIADTFDSGDLSSDRWPSAFVSNARQASVRQAVAMSHPMP